MTKTIEINNISGKSGTHRGVPYPAPVSMGQHAKITPRVSIHLHGVTDNGALGKVYGKTFMLGDTAEYNSYNLSYYGTITSITAKTVTIIHEGQKTRLSIYDFNRRNHRFDLEKMRARNDDTMMYL